MANYDGFIGSIPVPCFSCVPELKQNNDLFTEINRVVTEGRPAEVHNSPRPDKRRKNCFHLLLRPPLRIFAIKNMRNTIVLAFLAVATVLAFAAVVLWGSVSIPPARVVDILLGGEEANPVFSFIVWENRLPMAVTAVLCGASLAAAGLMLQSVLRNPLAGPNILGIDAGANLGVALMMLAVGGGLGSWVGQGQGMVILAALAGALGVLAILLALNRVLRSSVMLLIAGVMLGYLASSAISLLTWKASKEGVQAYVLWGMGSFQAVGLARLPLFAGLSSVGLALSLLMVKPLNALLLGEQYAQNLGIRVGRVRTQLLLATGLLTATCTAFCGPISFIGLAVPHIARLLLRTANHRTLLPATMLTGALVALVCCSLGALPGESGVLPVNVLTPLIGAPVVIYVLLKLKHT